MRYFCTYFDENYLSRGLALYDSLTRHGGEFQIWVLCLTERCHQLLTSLSLPGIVLVRLEELERANPALAAVKQSRSRVEYYFTCSPSFPSYVFQQNPAIDLITYLDADLFFFASVELVFAEIGSHSIAITPHCFPPAQRDNEKYGIYNVGWISFRRDAAGLACLDLWRQQCIDWCYDRLEPDRYCDQKYLDAWPSRFLGVKVLDHPGINLAPWNLGSHQLQWDGARVLADQQPLVFFHFHRLKQLNKTVYDPQLADYSLSLSEVVKQHIYLPYLQALSARQLSVFGNPNRGEHGQATRWSLKRWLQIRKGCRQGKYFPAPPLANV